MTTSVLVLGAGMVGTCTALHLALRGHRVTLVDRKGPGQETSYGNAGIIQREAVQPYAFPREPDVLAKMLLGQGAALHYHWGALPALAPRLLRYWCNSHPERHAAATRHYARLIEHALSEHEPLIRAAGAEDLVRQVGYRVVYRDARALQQGADEARAVAQAYGLRHAVLDAQALAQAEPALRMPLAGAVHWLDPWVVSDPGELVQRYAQALERAGGVIAQGDATTLRATARGWAVRTQAGEVDAEHAVVALGPWSETLIRRFGYRLPLFVKRGYHRHYRGGEGPRIPLLDEAGGYVLAPMRRGVRLTTGAEFAFVDAPPTPVQVDRAYAQARRLFDLPEPVEAQPWMGARPCTVDMLPVIGPAPRHARLWFNFGHAHQGFTLGPVSGRLMAELIEGGPTVVDPAPYAPTRFG